MAKKKTISKGKQSNHFYPYVIIVSALLIVAAVALILNYAGVSNASAGEAIRASRYGATSTKTTTQTTQTQTQVETKNSMDQCLTQIQSCSLATKSEITGLQSQLDALKDSINNLIAMNNLAVEGNLDLGDTCSFDNECKTGVCDSSNARCANPVGASCQDDTQCVGVCLSTHVCGEVLGQGCFLPGTKVAMADGKEENIEDVMTGEMVLSYDEKTGENVPSRVIKTFIHDNISQYIIINNLLKVTKNHPTYVNGAWQEAGNIKLGDVLRDIDGNNFRVTSLKEENNPSIEVYNLEVEGTHTYYAEGLLVHNK